MSTDFLHGVEMLEIQTGPRPIRTARFGTIGIVGTAPGADPEAFPLNRPTLIAGSMAEAAKLGGTGTLPWAVKGVLDQVGAVMSVVRVAEGADEAATIANVLGGSNSVDGMLEGVHALTGSESVNGVAPRILCAPGFTHQRIGNMANAVVAEMLTIAERMRGAVIADGPNTTDDAAKAYAGDWGSDRLYMVDPHVVVQRGEQTVIEPASARVAGVIARTDSTIGWHQSPSNQIINGILGTARPISYRAGDTASRANLLNEAKIATIIRDEGYRLWGNRSLSADPRTAFLSVRRTWDVLNESVQRAKKWAIDRAITTTFIEEVRGAVQAYIDLLEAQGRIDGGRCWADPDLNTPAARAQGQVFFNLEFSPLYPAERITFRVQITDAYIKEVLG